MRAEDLVAHRGYPLRFPENTAPGLAAAVASGARWVEIDVQLTADEVPVLFHDRTLQRVCGAPGAVHDLTWAQLGALPAAERARFGDAFGDVRVARLADLPALLAGRAEAFVEIKRVALERFGLDTVLDRVLANLAGIEDRCVLISFDAACVQAARARGWPRVGAILEDWGKDPGPVDCVFCDVDLLPAEGPLERGPPLAVYDVVSVAEARALHARGAAWIETFAIAEMIAGLDG